jgi:hypothetical protein
VLQLIKARVAASLQRGGLLRDPDVFGCPVPEQAANTGKPEQDVTGNLITDRRTASWVITEEHHRRGSAEAGKLGTGRGQLVTAHGDENEVEPGVHRVLENADPGAGPVAAEHVMRGHAVPGS